MTTRRDLLKGGIAAATLASFPESIRRALAIPAFHETGTIKDVKHVVILMQENRAFDLYFGTYKGVHGYGDRITIPLPNGRKVWEQLNSAGNVVCRIIWIKPRVMRSASRAHRTAGPIRTMPGTPAACISGRATSGPVDGLLRGGGNPVPPGAGRRLHAL